MALRNTLAVGTLIVLFGSGVAHAGSVFDGGYLGGQIGYGVLNTHLEGPRQGDGRKLDDLSGDGASVNLFGGYGKTFGKYYLGGELDASVSDGFWESRKDGGRLQDVRKRYDAALTARGGYLLTPQTMLYGRAGVAVGEFDSDLRVSAGTSFSQTDRELGVRLGFGVDHALSSRLFTRLDYAYTRYGDIEQAWSEGSLVASDNYANSDSTIRLGLGYRFGQGDVDAWDEAQWKAISNRLAGFYLGGQVAYENLMSLQKGPRDSGASYQSNDLGDEAPAAGLFVGYGTFFDRFYVGAELDGAFSNQGLESMLHSGGRQVTVQKEYDMAAAMRLGYLLDGGGLLYGRLGLAAARFNTTILLGDGRHFDQDDTQLGIRLGGGGEIPVNDAWFMRLDYTYTRYNRYEVDRSSTGQISTGAYQIENFENSESTVRLGLGYRFDTPEPRKRTALAPLGAKVGKFVVLPKLTLTGVYDDNIFSTRSLTEADYITYVTPSVEVKSNLDKHLLNLYASANAVRYGKNDSENYENYATGFDGRYDIRNADPDRSNLFGGASFTHDHESRDSADDVNGTEPSEYEIVRLYAGGYHRVGDVAVRIGGTQTDLDFVDAKASTGTINNDDRDRTMQTGGLWAGYFFAPRVQVYGQAAIDRRRYDLATDDSGFDRDSDGYRFLAGVKMDLPRGSKADVFAGYLTQNYDDAILADVKAPAFGANVTVRASQLTTLTGYVDRVLSETTTSGASSTLNTTVGGTLNYTPTQKLTVNTNVSGTNSHFKGIDRADDTYVIGAGFDYAVTRNVSVGADYSYRNRDSDVADQNYSGQQLSLHLASQF